ncbi:MAG: type IX secretion system membrane protein PorP/SprF [Candidatus Zhuqueibacterota bacterium]
MIAWKKILIGIVIISGILDGGNPRSCVSQNILTADPADIFDSKAIFLNSAVIPFQRRHVALGMQVYQMGFMKSNELGLNTGYFSLSLAESLPLYLNFGLSGQNFSTPLYDQTNFSLHFAARPMERISVGIKYNVFTKSYHQRYFDLVDINDPVFANGTTKFAQSIGAGVLFFPLSELALGLAVDHINRPDVSLSDDVFRQPLAYDMGIRYSYRHFSSSIHLNYMQEHWQFNWMLETRPTSISSFRLGLIQKAADFQVELSVLDGFSINYVFNYPLYEVSQISSGSHQINFIYELGRRTPLDEFQYTRYDEGKSPIFDLPSQFFVELNDATLEVQSQKILRRIENDVPGNALANLTEMELALNDSISHPQDFFQHGQVEEPLDRLSGKPKYSTKYDNYLAELADIFSGDGDESIKILTETASRTRAEDLLRDKIYNATKLAATEKVVQLNETEATRKVKPGDVPKSSYASAIELNPEKAVFSVTSLKMRAYRREWRLVILDGDEKEVKNFSGKNDVPETIEWDWRNQNGRLLQPGVYVYRLEWFDNEGKLRQSRAASFSVEKRSRTFYIDVCASPRKIEPEGTHVEIKLTQ